MKDDNDLIVSFEEHANSMRERSSVFGNGLEEIMPDMDGVEFLPRGKEGTRLADGIAIAGATLSSLCLGIASAVSCFNENYDDSKLYAFGSFALFALAFGAYGLYTHIHKD